MKTPLRVLIVEDSEFDARLLVTLLRTGGYEPEYARVETAEAMSSAIASRQWDVILADYNMPTFSAPQALKILQESRLDMPFIIVSGGIGEDIAVAAMKAGAHDYLMKGNLARLVPAVERELREAGIRRARRMAEESMRESEMRYRLLWENSADAVVMMDADGSIQFANPALETIFGYSPDEVAGRNISLLLGDVKALNQQELARFLHPDSKCSGRPVIETTGRTKDGKEVVVEIAFNDIKLHETRCFVAFVRDITERRRAEAELRENQEQFRVAREIQQHLFPKCAPDLPGFDIAGISHPAEATGGDYFDYLTMKDGRLGLVIGDVTGHGIGPALLMAETRAYLRIVSQERQNVGEILTGTNKVLAQDVGSERFVTLLLAEIDPETRNLVYSSAGHPPAYVIGADGEVRAELRRTGIPLGLRPDTQYSSSQPLLLRAGDLVLFTTDGIDEAMSPENQFFGMERALEVMRSQREKSSAAIVDALYRAVREFCRGTPQQDDFTAIVVKVM